MGHAGAIVEHDNDTVETKIEALSAAGAVVADQLTQIGALAVRELLAVPATVRRRDGG